MDDLLRHAATIPQPFLIHALQTQDRVLLDRLLSDPNVKNWILTYPWFDRLTPDNSWIVDTCLTSPILTDGEKMQMIDPIRTVARLTFDADFVHALIQSETIASWVDPSFQRLDRWRFARALERAADVASTVPLLGVLLILPAMGMRSLARFLRD